MRISRVYTRTGDKGSTSLVGGRVVEKDDARIEAYGTIDELNSVVGLARVFNERLRDKGEVDIGCVDRIEAMLRRVQNDLFDIGGDLATLEADRWSGMIHVGDAEVGRLEGWCDELNEHLGPLKEFILPGGGPVGGFLHQARTVCRRAERCLVSLMREAEDINEGCLRYLNRLSDYFFVLGRWAAKVHGEAEYFWEHSDRSSDGLSDAGGASASESK